MVVVLMGFGVFKVHLFLMDAICLSSRRCLFEDGEGLHTGFVLQELLFEDKYSLTAVLSSQMAFFEDKFSSNAVPFSQKPVLRTGQLSSWGLSSGRLLFEENSGNSYICLLDIIIF